MKTQYFQKYFVGSLLAFHASACPSCMHRRDADASVAPNPSSLLKDIINAISPDGAIKHISSFSLESPSIYRSQTLTQSYNLQVTDQSVAADGSQTLAFRVNETTLQARIDRSYQYNDYWIWAFPGLQPAFNYSVVIQDGPTGYACFNEGQNSFFSPDPTEALGYADGFLTDYLVHEAHQYALIWLLQRFIAEPDKLHASTIRDPVSGATLRALEHSNLGLSLALNETSSLPHLVRSIDNDPLLGPSITDIVFTNYSSVALPHNASSILLPHRYLTVHNGINIIEDFIIDKITLNPIFPPDYFDPVPIKDNQKPRTPPTQSKTYPRAEVHAFYEAGLWGGAFGEQFNTSDVTIQHPIAGNTAVKSIFVGYADYVQLLVEIGDDLIITDAAPHRSTIIIDWVRENMGGRNITYVVPSHHHRDHAGGIADYAASGAKVVVPEVAKDYYKAANLGNITIITYNAAQPFMLSDSKLQFRSFWSDENPHARDWTYSLVTKACPSAGDTAVVFNADVVSPGLEPDAPRSEALRWDTAYARQWLVNAMHDGVPRESIVLGAHGSANISGIANTMLLQQVIDITGFDYPKITADTLKTKGRC